MKFTSEMALRLRDIFNEKMFSVHDPNRIKRWLRQLDVKIVIPGWAPRCLIESREELRLKGFVFVDCRCPPWWRKMPYDLLIPPDLAEKILVLGEIPPYIPDR